MVRVLYAILICSDPDCAREFEGWGEPGELDRTACECGCTLQAIAFCEARPALIDVSAPRLELRQAA